MNNFTQRLLLKDFLLVIIDHPYDLLPESESAQSYYAKMLGLKISGFQAGYGYGALPFDNSDYFATHKIILKKEADDNFIPVLAYRTISLDRCLEFGIEFPILGLAKKYKIPEHLKAIEEIIAQHESSPHLLSYDSSFTIHPNYRNHYLQDLMTTIHVLYHTEKNTPHVIGGGMHKFKLEKKYYYWGYEDLKLRGKALGSFKLGNMNNETGSLFYLKNFSKEARSVAQGNISFWNSRVEITGKNIKVPKSA